MEKESIKIKVTKEMQERLNSVRVLSGLEEKPIEPDYYLKVLA